MGDRIVVMSSLYSYTITFWAIVYIHAIVYYANVQQQKNSGALMVHCASLFQSHHHLSFYLGTSYSKVGEGFHFL